MTLKEIGLDNLSGNDYNPRKTFNDAKMQELKESIENMGLLQPLTVRENGGGYEVIAGSRRFRALQEVESNDYQVPTNVVDADDDEARLIALSENLERSDLTAVEEAKAFAEYVDITVSNEEGEVLSEAGVGVSDSAKDGHGLANYKDYTSYLKGGPTDDSSVGIRLPAETSQSVESAANKIPGVTKSQIRNRLELLLLPDDLLDAVDNGTLQKSVARELVKFRKLGDVEQMHDEMLRLGKKDKYRGDGVNRRSLSSEVEKRIETIQSQEQSKTEVIRGWFQDAEEERSEVEESLQSVLGTELSTLYQLVRSVDSSDGSVDDIVEEFVEGESGSVLVSEDELIDGIDVRKEPFSELGCVMDNSVSLMKRSQVAVESAAALHSALDLDREDEITDEISNLREVRNNLSSTRDWLKNNDSNECPHCHSQVTAPTLDDEVERLSSKISTLKDEVEGISEQRSEVKKVRNQLRSNRGDYEDTIQPLLYQTVDDEEVFEIEQVNGEPDSISVSDSHDLSEIEEPDEGTRSGIMQDALYVEQAE